MDLEDSLRWSLALNVLRGKLDQTAEAVYDGWKQQRLEPQHFKAYRLDVEVRLPLFYARWKTEYLKVRLTE